MKILIVEDDDRIALPVQEDLVNQHHLVKLAFDGEEALRLAGEETFDLILLDLMLPKVDGLTVCRTLRERGCPAAIIMITARGRTASKIEGLDCGADDYLPKPFELDELSARMRAVMRRGAVSVPPVVRCGDLAWEASKNEIAFNGVPLILTPTEYRLLSHLINHPERIFSKNDLIEKLWLVGEDVGEDVIKTHIKGLRIKLTAAGASKNLVETVYGTGYRLKSHAE
jgi:two-component system response regulator QseB